MALDNYRLQQIIPNGTKAKQISDTVESLHQTINTPVVTPEDRILHALTILTYTLTDTTTTQSDDQLYVITSLRDTSSSQASPNETPDPPAPIPLPSPSQNRWYIKVQNRMLKHPKLPHPITPPRQIQGCPTNLRRVSHIQRCKPNTTSRRHLQGCTTKRSPQKIIP